jgi:hypothetical protein
VSEHGPGAVGGMGGADQPGIDPARMAIMLDVLAEINTLPFDHPDWLTARDATSKLWKSQRQRKREERREAVLANDAAVIAATATGAPRRRGLL